MQSAFQLTRCGLLTWSSLTCKFILRTLLLITEADRSLRSMSAWSLLYFPPAVHSTQYTMFLLLLLSAVCRTQYAICSLQSAFCCCRRRCRRCCCWWCWWWLKVVRWHFMGSPFQSYGASPALILNREAGTRFTYLGGMEGWVDLGG